MPAEIARWIDQAKQHLHEATDRRHDLRGPEPTEDNNFVHPETGNEYNYRAAETWQVLQNLDEGILTRYPLDAEGDVADLEKEEAMPTRDQVFISYNHKDNEANKWMETLQIHLKPLVRSGAVKAWSDQQIKPGSKWYDEIQQALAVTKVAVFLVTPNFLASDFIWEKELKPLLDEADQGNVAVLWVPVRASLVEATPLAKYRALGDPAKPLANMKAERDKAWVEISKAIRDALNP